MLKRIPGRNFDTKRCHDKTMAKLSSISASGTGDSVEWTSHAHQSSTSHLTISNDDSSYSLSKITSSHPTSLDDTASIHTIGHTTMVEVKSASSFFSHPYWKIHSSSSDPAGMISIESMKQDGIRLRDLISYRMLQQSGTLQHIFYACSTHLDIFH